MLVHDSVHLYCQTVHSMLPATGTLIEGEGPRDGCSRAPRDFFDMLRVWKSVVPNPTGMFVHEQQRRFLVIQTGKLQPVLIWREKPVLLALLRNLGIPVPASYPVFRTKWREIS